MKKVPEISEISVDIGMSREEAEKCIPLGSKVTFKRQFTELLNNQISSNCLDDRAGVAALLLALDKLKASFKGYCASINAGGIGY